MLRARPVARANGSSHRRAGPGVRLLEEAILGDLLERSGVCVNLRYPTKGETSGAAIRALVLGRLLVVSDIGWFSELPDEVVAKVQVDAWKIDLLAVLAVLARLAGDGDSRTEMSRRALDYVERERVFDRLAELCCAALDEGARRSLIQDSVVADAEGVVDVGLADSDRELREVAGALREAGFGD
jgi:hypothetical protein